MLSGMTQACDAVIVGGGAAGLAAAIFAAQNRPGLRVTILDGAKRLGAKILVSGGGRCNVTHARVTEKDYTPASPFVRHVLAGFDQPSVVQWFASLGVTLKTEQTGKLFPVSDDAHTVLDALLRRCDELGVVIHEAQRVERVERLHEGFVVGHAGGLTECKSLVLATGGRSLPRTGSDGSGYTLAQSLGHTVRPTYPALAPLVLSEPFVHVKLSGVSCGVELRVSMKGRVLARRGGAMLWTHFGVSGPAVMDISRQWIISHARGDQPEMHCRLWPSCVSFDEVDRKLVALATHNPRRSVLNALEDELPARLTAALLEFLTIPNAVTMGQLSRDMRRKLAHALDGLVLPVLRDRGWNYAEVTAGGVPLDEVDYRTMASKKCPGLHLVGELLDCDGRIGGFNFHWAWATGKLAGGAVAGAHRSQATGLNGQD
ncbi:MAG: aminoacetone oxidase family FAD-binding enzyme [Phycisphaera sp.]|nr:aminoacetone oxidase family FAD-binding enzyme [Phycisphaera sp.]